MRVASLGELRANSKRRKKVMTEEQRLELVARTTEIGNLGDSLSAVSRRSRDRRGPRPADGRDRHGARPR